MIYAKSETIKKYYDNGVIKSAITYKDGKKNGVEHIYYPDGATLRLAHKYVKGKLHGLQQEYASNAMLTKEENFNHGKLDGVSRYYIKGLLAREITYKNGDIDGLYREFFPTGVTKVEIKWDRGVAVEGYVYDEVGKARAMSSKKLQSLKSNDIVPQK